VRLGRWVTSRGATPGERTTETPSDPGRWSVNDRGGSGTIGHADTSSTRVIAAPRSARNGRDFGPREPVRGLQKCPFAGKPSCGLEPQTPSLPSRSGARDACPREGTAGHVRPHSSEPLGHRFRVGRTLAQTRVPSLMFPQCSRGRGADRTVTAGGRRGAPGERPSCAHAQRAASGRDGRGRGSAAGMANKEIAQALFVTARTVHAHLGSAYRKLRINTRTKLAAALAPGAQADG
jgi:hypothetical protein